MTSTSLEPHTSQKIDIPGSVLSYQPGQLNADTPIPQAIIQIFMIQLQLILTYKPVAIDGSDPEGIHKLRVGLRRLRTALKLFKPYLQPDIHASLKEDSRQIARELGAMRDLDVMKIHYFNYFQENKSELPYKEDWRVIFQEETTKTRENIISLIESTRFTGLVEAVHRVCRSPELYLTLQNPLPPHPGTVREFIPKKISGFFSKIQTYKDTLTPQSDYEHYHALRLDIKKFRYLLEFFPDILDSKAAQKIINMLVEIQDILGYLNDCVTANRLLARQKKNKNHWPESLQQYQAYRKKEYKDLLDRFQPAWKKLNKQANIRIIQKELTRLES